MYIASGPHKITRFQIALLSNDMNEYYSQKCKEAGADWIFDKAFESEDLREVVRHQAAMNSWTIKTECQHQ